MNKQELEKLITEHTKKLDELKSMVDGLVEDKCEWKDGELYWFVSETGCIVGSNWYNEDGDNFGLAEGNIFRTEAEAEHHLKMMKLAQGIRKQGFEPDWSIVKAYHSCWFDHQAKEMSFGNSTQWEDCRTYFLTKEAAKEAFKDVSNEDFLYMLRARMI